MDCAIQDCHVIKPFMTKTILLKSPVLQKIVNGLKLCLTVLAVFFLTSKISQFYKLVVNSRKLLETRKVVRIYGLCDTGLPCYQTIYDKDYIIKVTSASHMIVSGAVQI